MSVMTRFTVRSLKKNRARTAVSVIGIALSCALLMAVFTTAASMQSALYQRSLNTEGAWQAYVPALSQKALETFERSDRVSAIATYRELGSAQLSDQDRKTFDRFMTVRTLPRADKGTLTPGGASITKLPSVIEGRLPQSRGEVMLPDYCRGKTLGVGQEDAGAASSGPLAIGSTITLALGMREGENAAGDAVALDSTQSAPPASAPLGANGPVDERLVDVSEKTYTVVGFYQRQQGFYGSDFTGAASSVIAVASQSEPGDGLIGAYLVTQGFTSQKAMTSFVYDAFDSSSAPAYFHSSLLIYQGISSDRSLWNSLWNLAAVLAIVIIVASVSLIYNSFAISVSERTRQFGLLSSIGASKKQLRGSVLFEALALGAVGIPLGLVLGVAGAAAAFTATQDAFAAQLGLGGGILLVVDPLTTVLVAALSLFTLLISAWIPARRASRTSAIDALRLTRDVRLSRRAVRKARAAVRKQGSRPPAFPGFRKGLSGRLFGVPGYIALKNLSRSSGRGRIVVASLAVSVALIVVAGSTAMYLMPISDRASSMNGAGSGADIVIRGGMRSDNSPGASGAEVEAFKRAAEHLAGVTFVSSYKQGQSEGIIPASMLSPEGDALGKSLDERNRDDTSSSFDAKGNYIGNITIFFIDQSSWTGLLQQLGANEDESDPTRPQAVVLNRYQAVLPNQTYADTKPFASSGSIDLYAVKTSLSENSTSWVSLGLKENPDGSLVVEYLDQNSGPADIRMEKPAKSVTDETTVDVLGMTESEPAAVNAGAASSHFPVLILPDSAGSASAAEQAPSADNADVAAGGADGMRRFSDYGALSLSFKAPDHAEAMKALETLIADYPQLDLHAYDITASAEQYRVTVQAVQLFITCFAAITILIAVATVFNTLTNSIMLRTHEFAVLKSVGMADKAFARMLVCECLSYALRGLIFGLMIALAATYLMYRSMSISFTGLGFTLPWASVGLAAIVVVALLAVSVMFALHKGHASRIIDALRQDTA